MLACQESKTRSDLQEKEEAIKARDDTRLTRKCDLECEKLRARGLARWDKVTLSHLKKFDLAEDLPRQLQPLWAELHGTQGGAELEQWVDELLYLDHGINPPKKLLETLSHTLLSGLPSL